jgi:hypothetical protein
MAEMVTSVFGGHKKISNSDIFPQRMLIWIDDHVFGSTNLPQRSQISTDIPRIRRGCGAKDHPFARLGQR